MLDCAPTMPCKLLYCPALALHLVRQRYKGVNFTLYFILSAETVKEGGWAGSLWPHLYSQRVNHSTPPVLLHIVKSYELAFEENHAQLGCGAVLVMIIQLLLVHTIGAHTNFNLVIGA